MPEPPQPATEPPATEPPATEPPATEPPATEPPATEPPEFWEPQSTDSETREPEPWDMKPEPEESSEFNFESDLDDDDFFLESSDLETEEVNFSPNVSDLEMENPYQDITENDPDSDDDFSFAEGAFDMEEEKAPPLEEAVQKEVLEFEEDLISFEGPELFEDTEPVEASDTFEQQAILEIEKDEPEPILSPDLEMDDQATPVIEAQTTPPENDADIKTEMETENDLPETETEEIAPPPKKEKKVIVKPFAAAPKPKPVIAAKPKHIKGKKKSSFRLPVIILLLILLLGIGGYLAMFMTGYKLPVIDQYIKKPIPEISEAKPIPNQKSVNGRFVTNSTAGTLFVITGRVENPSNIALSHIEIRGALITKDKAEAKIKNAFCGNIITEEMLKTGNISDINALLTQKEGAHKINVNVAPGASVPFMVVFSDLPEKLENFTIKIAGFDKALN